MAAADDVGADHLPAVPALALVVPPFLELDGEAVLGLLDPLHPHLSRGRVAGGPLGDDVRARSPVWIRQCGSDRSANTSGANSPSGTVPVSRNGSGCATATLVSSGRRVRTAARRCGAHDCAPCSRPGSSATTAIVASRSAVGLNSTIAVPAVTSGRCPGGA